MCSPVGQSTEDTSCFSLRSLAQAIVIQASSPGGQWFNQNGGYHINGGSSGI